MSLANAADEHAVDLVGKSAAGFLKAARPGDAVVLHAGALQQRLREGGLEVDVPIAGLRAAAVVVLVVVDVVAELERAAGGRRLGDARRVAAQLLPELRREEVGNRRQAEVLRPVVVVPENAGVELGVELRQRRLDAGAAELAAGVAAVAALDKRRVVAWSPRCRRPGR